MSRFRPWLLFLSITSFALLFACDSQEETQPPGIVLGKSIAGIEIGMDSIEVKNRLGEPDEIVQGDFPGVIYLYTTGEFAGLEIEYSGFPEFVSGVVDICASEPFQGATRDGIGLGFRLATVIELMSARESQAWLAFDAMGDSGRVAFRNYFDWVDIVMSFEADQAASESRTEPVGAMVRKICMMPTDHPQGWIDPEGQIFFPVEFGELQNTAGCTSLSGPWAMWRLECDFVESNTIPENLRSDGQAVLISGLKVLFPRTDVPGGLPVRINTIRRVP